MSATAELYDGNSIAYFPNQKIGEGTEKEFFLTEARNLLIGFYKDRAGTSDPERLKRLTRIIEDYNPVRNPETGKFWEKHFCWPSAIVKNPSPGILVPRFPSQYFFSDGKREKKGKWFFSYRLSSGLEKKERGNLRDRLGICRWLSRAVSRMHSAGLAHSDLSGNNVLMDPQNGTCMIIDVDSLVVRGIFPPKVLGTRGYIAPEIVATSMLPLHHPKKILPGIKTDLHSLAIIIYETLLLRHPLEGKKVHSDDPEEDDLLSLGKQAVFIENPKDDSNRPEDLKMPYISLGPYLALLFERAFTEGLKDPEARPTALEWEDAIIRTLDLLHPCSGKDCWYEWFVCRKESDLKCSFCGQATADSIPLMHLFRFFQTGQYISENRCLAVWENRKLHEWHIRSDLSCPPEPEENFREKGIFVCKDKNWFLQNRNSDSMVSASGKSIHPEEYAEIKGNKTVLLYPRTEGRVAVFEFTKLQNRLPDC